MFYISKNYPRTTHEQMWTVYVPTYILCHPLFYTHDVISHIITVDLSIINYPTLI